MPIHACRTKYSNREKVLESRNNYKKHKRIRWKGGTIEEYAAEEPKERQNLQ